MSDGYKKLPTNVDDSDEYDAVTGEKIEKVKLS